MTGGSIPQRGQRTAHSDTGIDATCPRGHLLYPIYFETDGNGNVVYVCPQCP